MDIIANRRSFKDEARWQGLCAACGTDGPWQAHHVIYEQHVERRRPEWVYDTRNSLRLCTKCHARHHDGTPWKLNVARLPLANLIFAVDLFGPELAIDYYERRYQIDDPAKFALRVERAAQELNARA